MQSCDELHTRAVLTKPSIGVSSNTLSIDIILILDIFNSFNQILKTFLISLTEFNLNIYLEKIIRIQINK